MADSASQRRAVRARFALEADPESLRKFREGDRQTLEKVYRAYAPGVLAYIRSQVDSAADAGDILHEVFVAAFSRETRRHVTRASPFDRFLLGIARNRVRHGRVEAVDALRQLLDGEGDAGRVGPKDVLQGFVFELDDREWEFFRGRMMQRTARFGFANASPAGQDALRVRELRSKLLRYLKRARYLEPEKPSEGRPMTPCSVAWSA